MLRRHALPLAFAPLLNAQDRLTRIKSYIDSQVTDGPFPGIQAMLLHRGQLVLSHTAGEAQPDSIYRFHSMTKAVSSAAIMTLYEQGKFLLDEPVAKYIPGFANTRVLSVESDPASPTVPLKRPITIQHLLNHTSGLSNAKDYKIHSPFATSHADMAQRLPTLPLAHQPGEGWRYGMSIEVIGYLIELFSGQPLDVFLKEQFFGPLGMHDSDFHVPAAKLKRLAKEYMLDASGKLQLISAPPPDRNPAFLAAGGGLFATAHDYLRFAQMLLNGGSVDGVKILSRTTVDLMLRNHVPLHLFPPGGPNGRTGYGFGIGGAVLLNAAESATLSVDGEFAWGGAAGTYFWVDRKSQISGLWCVQRRPFSQPASKRFKVLAYQALS